MSIASGTLNPTNPSWGKSWEWNDIVLEMPERRFAIIDGFKRLTCVDILRRQNKDIWEHVSLMCCVVDISLCHVWQRLMVDVVASDHSQRRQRNGLLLSVGVAEGGFQQRG